MDRLTGTLVWYYCICQRQCWLMAHEVNPCEDNELLDLGRQLHEQSYQRDRKEIELPGMKIDFVRTGRESGTGETSGANKTNLVVCEVKKSDRFLCSATMQLCYYLWRLRKEGINAMGELRIPKKKKRIPVELSEGNEKELERIITNIQQLVVTPKPPPATKSRFCKRCAYLEFCFA